MKRTLAALAIVACVSAAVPVWASTAVSLYVDTGPNANGSPDFAPWWDATKADVAFVNYTNMRSGMYPGMLMADAYEEITYDTGDLGQRLYWTYFVFGETTTSLDGRFDVKWVVDWEGQQLTYDHESDAWVTDGAEAGWYQPSDWEDYEGGVIGAFDFSWSASDNDAAPLDTGGSIYDETNQADIDALRLSVIAAQTHATGYARYMSDGEWHVDSLAVQIVPEPGTGMLLLASLGLIGLVRRSR